MDALLRKERVSGPIRIESSELNSGQNLFRIEDDGKEIATGKIVLQ